MRLSLHAFDSRVIYGLLLSAIRYTLALLRIISSTCNTRSSHHDHRYLYAGKVLSCVHFSKCVRAYKLDFAGCLRASTQSVHGILPLNRGIHGPDFSL